MSSRPGPGRPSGPGAKHNVLVPDGAHGAVSALEFPDQRAWERWLEQHHGSSPDGVWLRIAKKRAAAVTVDHPQALESAICFGWIDAQRRPLDDTYFLQRFTPRRRSSRWSQINRKKATELIEARRMRPPGLAEVERAKADGRWDAAYAPQSAATVPDDFQAALDANPKAKAFFETLTGIKRYAFLYRIGDAKRPETRTRRIERFVSLLEHGRTLN